MPIQILARANKRAEILIHEAIGENWYGDGLTSKRFIKDLENLGDVDTITVRINSPGGAVFDGIAIYNALKAHKAKKEVQVEGLAASAASFIAMCGDTITMGEGSMMMIHNPWTFAMGDADDMREVADMLDKVGDSLIDIYHARTKIDRKELKTMLDAETWMSASDAVEKGFADQTGATASDDDEKETEKAAAEHRDQFKKFADSCRTAAAEIPLRVAAEIFKSAPADATTQETDMPQSAAASAKPADTQNADVAAAVAQALAAEQARTSAIRALFTPFAEHRELLDACIGDQKCTVDSAREKLLNKLGESYTPTAGAANVQPGADERDKFFAGAEAALLARAGKEPKKDIGNEFYGKSLVDLAEFALARQGVSVRGLTKDAIARKVLASHTTSDFPLLLANTAGKVLRKAYSLAPVTWNTWCKTGSVSDFKQASRHTLGSFSSLLTKPERGEYQHGTIGEERETITAITKGRYISLSREMIVNDDLGGFMDMSSKMGRAAARTVEADVYTLLTSASGAGPTMSDTGAFFNATAITTAGGHANLTSSGTAISVASLAVGEAAMAAQKDKTLNDFVMIQPKILLVSPAKKQLAWEVVNSSSDPSQSNPNKRNYAQTMALTVVSSPYLSGTPWYLFSDPADVEAFEVAFLDGVQEPFIDEEIEFMTDAMNLKVRLDYGVAAIDWRAGYRNAGA